MVEDLTIEENDKPLKMTDSALFNKYCYFTQRQETSPENGSPIVTIEIIDDIFAAILLLDNSGVEEGSHLKYNGYPFQRTFKIDLRKILATHFTGQFGPMQEIDPKNVNSLGDVLRSDGTGIDYSKLIAEIYAQLLPFKDRAFQQIPLPKAVYELTQLPEMFGIPNIDKAAKKVTVSYTKVTTFPNPTYIERVVSEITAEGWAVVFEDQAEVDPVIKALKAAVDRLYDGRGRRVLY